MFTSLVVAAAVAPAAPLPADAARAPAGPAPWVVHLRAEDAAQLRLQVQRVRTVPQTMTVVEVVNGQPVQKQVTRDVQAVQTVVVPLADQAAVSTADGAPLAPGELLRRAKDGVTLLVSADGKAIDRAWLGAVAPGTLVVTGEAVAGAMHPPQQIYFAGRTPPTTPAPRLTLLAAGPDGTVRIVTRAANGGLPTSRVAARVVMLNNGNGVVPQIIEEEVYNGPVGGPEVKPLADAGFDAYEPDGRRVSREDAVRRLRAGGLVLLAADGRVPDLAFLAPFRNVLVLVSSAGLAATGDRTAPAPAPVLAPQPVLQPVAPALRVAPARLALPARPVPAPAPPAPPR